MNEQPPNYAMHTNRCQQMRIQELDFSNIGFADGVCYQRRSVILDVRPRPTIPNKGIIVKARAIALGVLVGVLTGNESSAYSVYIPPANIVKNGNFQSLSADWLGEPPAVLSGGHSIPNDNAALVNDIYQDLPTNPGQQYSLSFYAAADLFVGPSVIVAVDLNNTTLVRLATPPYAYNPQVNRYEQMHWQQVTRAFIASSSTTRLEFVGVNTYFGLAAVSAVPVPEPASFTLVLIGGLAASIVRRRFK